MLLFIPTLIGLTVIVFTLLHIGGTTKLLAMYLSPRLTGAARAHVIAELDAKFHLNQPVYVQYFYWLIQILEGNWGITNTPLYSGPVTQAIEIFFPNTLILTIFAAIIIWLVSIPLGVHTAVNRDKPSDNTIRVASLTFYAMPWYLIGVVLIIIFAVYFRVLPIAGTVNPSLVSGLPWYHNGISYPTHILLIDALLHGDFGVAWNAFLHLIMPSVTLSLGVMAALIRLMRGTMLETMDQDFVNFARAKGVPEKVVINLHAKNNALLPVVTNFGYLVAGLLGGVVVIEDVFSYPGIGMWLTSAMLNNDMGGIMGGTLLFGLILVTTSLFLDILYAKIDPRIRY
ncbi:MAG: ABC transporter permease [Caldisphaeraceae archaeon]|nr:ABC transporter permease [Caldisphaeraceae archaeon]